MNRHDAEPAFPCDLDAGHHIGLSKLDYFAGQALSGVIWKMYSGEGTLPKEHRMQVVWECYCIAQAMAEESDRRKGLGQ